MSDGESAVEIPTLPSSAASASAAGAATTPTSKKRVKLVEQNNQTFIIRTPALADGDLQDADGGGHQPPIDGDHRALSQVDADTELDDGDDAELGGGGGGDGTIDNPHSQRGGSGGGGSGAESRSEAELRAARWVLNRWRVGVVLLFGVVALLWYAQAPNTTPLPEVVTGSNRDCAGAVSGTTLFDSAQPPRPAVRYTNSTDAAPPADAYCDATVLNTTYIALPTIGYRLQFDVQTIDGAGAAGTLPRAGCASHVTATCLCANDPGMATGNVAAAVVESATSPGVYQVLTDVFRAGGVYTCTAKWTPAASTADAGFDFAPPIYVLIT